MIYWITGRAASGKSFYLSECAKKSEKLNVKALFFNDEDEMLKIVKKDKNKKYHKSSDEDDSFELVSDYPFDKGIEKICTLIKNELKKDKGVKIFVELARGVKTAKIDITYKKALKIISKEIIDNSKFIYIETTFSEQLKRNNMRSSKGRGTPEKVMKELYYADDFKKVSDKLNHVVIRNNSGFVEFREKVKNSIDDIL